MYPHITQNVLREAGSKALTKPYDKTKYRFDGFSVDAEDFVVEKDGRSVALTPRAFDVLLLLLRNAGHVVDKNQIFEEVWRESFVSDNALTKIIKELRHALSDSAETPHYIETIPKRGYRFIGPVARQVSLKEEADDDRGGRRVWLLISIAAAVLLLIAGMWFLANRGRQDNLSTPKAIAVLPFKPLNPDGRDESLEIGMAETLITRLSTVRNIVVRPIGSVRKFTDLDQDAFKAGEELQAEAVLDGSIQRTGERIRVTVRLLDVRQRSTLWEEQFDESFTDIFRVQDSIAGRIASALAVRLTRQEQQLLAKHLTENPEAYQLYLQGQFTFHRRGGDWVPQSLQSFTLALEKDPEFALAHIGMAECYMMLSGRRVISMQEAERRAGEHIAKALEIDKDLAHAHNALAELKYQYQYDWSGAEMEFKTALELNPNVAWIHQAYGWFLMSQGRFDEANTQMDLALELDPTSLTVNVGRGRLYFYMRNYQRATQVFQKLVEQEPNDLSLQQAILQIYEQRRMYPQVVETLLKIQAARGVPPAASKELKEIFEADGWEGVLQLQLRRLQRRPGRPDTAPPWAYATLYTRLGEKEKAFYWYEKAFEEHNVNILQFKIDPANDLLRDDPRYAQLLHRIGLEP